MNGAPSVISPPQMVAHLKQRVQELKDELAMATGEERSEELTQEERDKYAVWALYMLLD